MHSSDGQLVWMVRFIFRLAVIIAAVLVIAGLGVFPAAQTEWKATLPGVAGVGLTLCVYAFLGLWGAARLDAINPLLLQLTVGFGLAAATIYSVEIVLEYIVLPRDNTRYGYVEFGLVFMSYVAAGLVAGYKTQRVRNGTVVSAGAALISTLIWYIVVLGTTYVMKGTARQAAVLRAEGDFDDFARSGSIHFEAWLMQDFLGAGFYHLLLGLVIACLLGTVGGLIGRFLPIKPKVFGRPA